MIFFNGADIFPTILHINGGRKIAIRQFLLPYQKKMDALFKEQGMTATERCDYIAAIFYGCGLEKDSSTGQLQKYLQKANTDTFWDYLEKQLKPSPKTSISKTKK